MPPADELIFTSITNLENRLEKHIAGTNDRLDVLIDLTRQMASMSERQQRHSDDIAKLEKKVSEDHKDFVVELEKTRDKIDRVSELYIEKFEELATNYLDGLVRMEEGSTKRVEHLAGELQGLKTDYDKRIASGQAVFKVVMAIFIAVQGFAGKYLSDIRDDIDSVHVLKDKISSIDATVKVLEGYHRK